MTPKKTRVSRFWSAISPLATVGFILGASAVIIAYGRGYRLSTTKESIVNGTGLLSVTSDPVGARIYIDGTLKNATNNSITIDPGQHTIRMSKDGYLSWEKTILIEKEIVSQAYSFLFPINPSLSPLTNSGVLHPTLSPDGSKVAYLIPANPQGNTPTLVAVWVYELADKTLGFNRDPKKVAEYSTNSVADSVLRWSPDSTEILIDSSTEARLIRTAKNEGMTIVTQTVETILTTWQSEEAEKHIKQLSSFKPDIITIASSSAKIIAFSPDETKILYEATASATLPIVITPPLLGTNSTPEERTIVPGKLYVYDGKEDKNYFLFDRRALLPSPTPTPIGVTKKSPVGKTPTLLDLPQTYPIHWFPTNRHLVLTINGKIDILEYDRTNWVTVYQGPFVENFIAPWPGGSRIVIVTNLNPGSSPLPNLYTVNLR